MHVGLDTVTLEGKPFRAKVSVGDRVHKGDVLMEIDWDMIQAAGLESVTPILITEADDSLKLHINSETGTVKNGQPIMEMKE